MSEFAEIVTIQGMAPWTVSKDAKSDRYVGSCAVLNLSTEGDSWSEIVEMTQDVMGLLFDTLNQSGELAEFLAARGFTIEKKKVRLDDGGSKPQFDIPSPIFFTPSPCLA